MKIPVEKSPSHGNFFQLKANSNNEFVERSKDVFAGLDEAEVKHSDFIISQGSSGENSSNHKSDPTVAPEELDARHKFKRPVNRRFKGRSNRQHVPGYKSDPSKWKKHSLADVSDMSDSSNTKAALSFLNELQAKNPENKPGASDDSIIEDAAAKHIVFHKPKPLSTLDAKQNVTCRGSTVCMPEYAVGEKMQKKSKKTAGIEGSCEQKMDLDCQRSFGDGNILEDSTSECAEADSANPKDSTEAVTFKKKGKKVHRSLRKRDDQD